MSGNKGAETDIYQTSSMMENVFVTKKRPDYTSSSTTPVYLLRRHV